MPKRVPARLPKTTLQGGFSLPVAIIIGFVLILGSVSLASRSTWGIFGSIFSSQSKAARNAAEIGMTQFVAELNKERNRWLLVVRNNAEDGESGCGEIDGDACQEDPDFDKTGSDPLGDLWGNRNASLTILELRQNPCIVTKTSGATDPERPSYARLDPNDAPLSATGEPQAYGKWYVNDLGAISSSSTNARQSFRLVKVIRQPFAGKAKTPPIDTNNDGKLDENDRYMSVWRDRLDDPTGVGSVTLFVEGQSYVNDKIVASVLLEKEFELTPKCCGVPFGGEHGNVNYAIITSGNAAGTSVCIEKLGLGLLAGAAGTDSGVINVKGKATDIEDETADAVNPIYCLASNLDACSIKVPDSIDVAIIDQSLPEAPTFCTPSGGVDLDTPKDGNADEVYASSNPCSSTGAPAPGALEPTTFDALIDSGSDFVSKSTDGKTYVVNSSAGNIPSFCLASDPVNSQSALHCNISQIAYPNNNNIAFVTGSRPIRLYFPNADPGKKDPILKQAGNGEILHCTSFSGNNCVGSTNTTDLSMFGSNTLPEGSQTLTLNGTADTANMFMYFPIANVDLLGTASFTGVLWTNEVGSTGNPTWIIPSTGLAAVYQLMDWNPNGLFEPPFYDFVLRATKRHRWIGG